MITTNVYDWHTALTNPKIFTWALENLCSLWRARLMAILTEGEERWLGASPVCQCRSKFSCCQTLIVSAAGILICNSPLFWILHISQRHLLPAAQKIDFILWPQHNIIADMRYRASKQYDIFWESIERSATGSRITGGQLRFTSSRSSPPVSLAYMLDPQDGCSGVFRSGDLATISFKSPQVWTITV